MFAILLAVSLLTSTPASHVVDTAAERTVIQDINQQRARIHVGALTSDDDLHSIAVARAEDMATRHYFDHKTPEGTMGFVDGLQKTAYRFTFAGENIALAPSVGDAEHGLWNSPTHRENLLDARFHRAGIAVVRVSAEQIYVIQVFSD